MEFLRRLLDRPRNERAFMLFPVGYPSEPSLVPDLKRKSLSEVIAEPPPVERIRAAVYGTGRDSISGSERGASAAGARASTR
jgi:hypothetical protein